ncbi:hypothetical protein C8A00DRAFT_45890 [Chaetomidium leptoderma]|uniref:Metallothionein-I gene transcription activator n=1 Tax=Chaetomidium leptoderma TaxID=669021 RepID=A0AAN6ZTW7_9PEZI|nr:hypothetical protein C8A00DRAFT_45890 [Chaetomidium leptoderma]
MSREQYQVPTGSGSPTIGTGSFSAPTARDYTGDVGGVMYYMCGDCAVRVPLEKGAPIRCQKCGARVLYKERTKRMVQFEAR